MEDKSSIVSTPKKRSSFLRYCLWLVFLFLLFIILIPILLQFSFVQKWVLDKATNHLTEKTGSKVTIEEVDFSIFEGLILGDVLITDPIVKSDTIISIGAFSTSLEENMLSLWNRKLLLKDINIEEVVINITTSLGQEQSNLDYFLSKLGTDKQSKNVEQEQFILNLQSINFSDIVLQIRNQDISELKLDVKEGKVIIDKLDLENKDIVISELMLSHPQYVEVKQGAKEAIDFNSKKDTIIDIKGQQEAFKISIAYLEISDGLVTRDDWNKAKNAKTSSLDVNHLHVSDFHLNADSTVLSSPFNLTSQIKSLTLHEDNGFDINQLNVGTLQASSQLLKLEDFILDTGKSKLGESLVFEYTDFADFKNFAQNIEIKANLDNSKLSFEDMMYFFPELKNSAFSRKNKAKWIALTGRINGTIDNLEAQDLYLSFNDLIQLKGYLSTFELTQSESALINLHVEQFNTSLTNLSQIIPEFTPPTQFYKLDPIKFSGDIDGFFKDFVIYGQLDSPLGRVQLDTRLDIKQGIDLAQYSGEVSLENFDMETWTENPDLGLATFSAEIIDGRGLTINNVYTDLTAELESFDYKGYSYKGVRLEGEFEKNLFNGKFTSSDPNAKMDFDGQIHIVDGHISSDFNTNIGNIDLIALNLSKEISSITGAIDLALDGSKSTDFVGSADIKNLVITYQNKEFQFDSLLVSSSPELNGSRNIIISSDVINGTVDGDFDFGDIVPAFKDHLVYAHPRWARKLNLKKSPGLRKIQRFGYKLHIEDTKEYLELAKINELRLVDVRMQGEVDTQAHSYESQIAIKQVAYKELLIDKLNLGIKETGKLSDHSVNVSRVKSGNTVYNPIEVLAQLDEDRMSIRLLTKELLDSFQRVDLSVNVYPQGEELVASISENTLSMFSSEWKVNPGNKVIYGDKKIQIEKFVITDGNRNIVVDDINQRGIKAEIQNFDFLTINGIIAYDKIQFAGEGDLNFSKVDIFEQSATSFDMDIETFTLNDVDYGSLKVNALDNGSGYVSALVFLNKPETGMNLDVGVDLNKKTKKLKGTITANNLPMETFEFIIDDGISNTAGEADVFDGRISGSLDNIQLSADAQVTGGTTTIDYLGAPLYLGDEKFKVTHKSIDLTNATIADKYGNIAVMTGGLYHKLFTKFTSDLQMESDYFLALDTEKLDNPSYYGQGIGDLLVTFSGPFSSTDITVDAVTGRGTEINIPVGEVIANYDESFIQEVSREDILKGISDTLLIETPTIEGVDIRMNLAITEEASIKIIFDESRNDIIKGIGNGNMRVVVSREGEFNIFGDYVIEEGDYLFTYLGGIVSKPFTVKRGGQITWTGDPINANINLEANYEKLRAPTTVFLAEYLTPTNNQEAAQRTDIDLKLYLTGTLYKPNVDFDIQFPELQGEIKSLADSKMRILRENEADLNEQVAGLIMFGSFLPSSTLGTEVGSASGLARTGYNTLSEMVSNQLSYLLSGFLQEALTENGFISGIDFEVGFSKDSEFDNLNNPETPSVGSNSIIPDEIEVHLKPRFQNDKWELDYGTSYVNSNNNSSIPNYVIHDFVIGFYLTDDRRLKLKAYGKWDKDIRAENGQKFGFGVNYKKEFGSLTDFKKALKEDLSKLKKEESN